jgi:hypothetical protein
VEASVTVDPTAIPWRRLAVTPVPDGHGGRLAHTSFIQRTNTVGGLAPDRQSPSTGRHGRESVAPAARRQRRFGR